MESLRLPLARLRPRDQVFYVSRNRTVLATARDGFVHGKGGEGLFAFQTRILSLHRYWIDGKAPDPAGVSNIEEHSQIAYYVIESPNADRSLLQGALGPGGRAATEAIELRLARFVSDGMQEEVELTNFTQKPATLVLELEVDADFAGISETHGKRRQEGRLERRWVTGARECELHWEYDAEHQYDHQGHSGVAHLHRGATLKIVHPGPEPVYDPERKRIRFEVALPEHGVWHCAVLVAANIDGRAYAPELFRNGFESLTRYEKERDRFLSDATGFDVGTPQLAATVGRTIEQARRDLVGLRLFDLDQEDGGWTMAAGLPVYIAYFGRDTLTTSWQASLLSTEMLRGTLAHLAETQATERDDWRDAQPGRFVHQIETGPLPALMFNPHGRYYGSLSGPALYPVALSDLWHWTGDRDLVRRYIDPALKGLAWLDREAKYDDDFYAYQSRSEQGVKNQSWKDSYDAIVYPDGQKVDDPIAPAEFQAYVFDAKVRMSEVMWWLGERDASKRLFDEAIRLRDRFNEKFWMEDEGCFGMGLDSKGELIRSVGSESAHILAAGFVKRERVERIVERLFRPDMFSGWGLRTLSALHHAFNPFSYHRGSVWPAEQAVFSMGLMRYGLHESLHRLTKAQFETAALFEFCRLPEVFCGHQRNEYHPIPGLYPEADSPQAWSSSAVVCMLQALLGIFPYAPLNALFIDPHLPEWLPELNLHRVRVGDATVDLHFHRNANGSTGYRVLNVRGKLLVIREASPWSLTTDFAERAIDTLSSFLPVHR